MTTPKDIEAEIIEKAQRKFIELRGCNKKPPCVQCVEDKNVIGDLLGEALASYKASLAKKPCDKPCICPTCLENVSQLRASLLKEVEEEDYEECTICNEKKPDVCSRPNAYKQVVGNDPDAYHTVCGDCDYENRMDI